MDVVLQYSPLVDSEHGTPSEEDVSLSAQCHDVLRSLPASAAGLRLNDLRHAAMHGSLRPHLFTPLSDEQLMELVKFLDFWELPLPWLQMAQAERGARLHLPSLPGGKQGAERPPLDAYSDAAATWALWFEIEPLLLSVHQSMSVVTSNIDEPRLWWSALQQTPPRNAVARALHVLCGARQPELVSTDVTVLSRVLAKAGDLEALQWAVLELDCPWDTRTCSAAAANGHLEVLQWLHANGCPWDEWTCRGAAKGAHMVVLQWARANGAHWDTRTCAQAARRGHLEVLQWLREHGCPWDEWTCSYAATGGHLCVLQWARANGAPWDEWTCYQAAKKGRLEVLQWAREHGCPWDQWVCSAAATGGHLSVLQWAHANGAPPWHVWTCTNAATGGHLEVLQWLREHGCPWNETACNGAAKHGHLSVLQWLRAHDCPWVVADVMVAAAMHRDVVKWVVSEECATRS